MRQIALAHLGQHAEADPLLRLVLAKQHDVPEWSAPAVNALELDDHRHCATSSAASRPSSASSCSWESHGAASAPWPAYQVSAGIAAFLSLEIEGCTKDA